MPTGKTEETKIQTVTLKKPHNHAGEIYPAGTVLDLPVDAANWVVANQIADKGDTTKEAK